MKRWTIAAAAFLLAGCQTGGVGSSGINLSSAAIAHPDVADAVTKKAIEYYIRPQLAHNVIDLESKYKVNALHKGNYGLGQIRCGTAKGIGFKGKCRDLLDMNTNLDWSMTYLKMALEKAQGDECHAVTLYNRGFGTNAKTSRYCRKVVGTVDKPR